MKKQVVVVGAGASGMTAAICAARAGAGVLLLDGGERAGKKLLATGNGKCNFTNRNMESSCYRSFSPEKVREVLSRFGQEDTCAYMESVGILPTEKNGYYYPASKEASSVVKALELELSALLVKTLLKERAVDIRREPNGFCIRTVKEGREEQYRADRLILACGSRAGVPEARAMDGYDLAKQLGHSVTMLVPGLTGLRIKGSWMKKWSGVRIDARVTVRSGGKTLSEDRGEVQLTDYGISGIPVFQVSRYAAFALAKKKPVEAVLDFAPEMSEQELCALLALRRKNFRDRTPQELLCGLLPQKLIPVLLDAGAYGSRLAACMKRFSMEVAAANPMSQAQVCAGGVPLAEIHTNTMESKKTPGLYLTGEMLDADGICGGYNLQWAWATGTIAGRSAAQ